MKKIFKIGFVAALVALLPTGISFAGNGDGDGKGTKSTVEIKDVNKANTVTLMVNTSNEVSLDNIEIITNSQGAHIKEILPVLGGLKIIINIDPIEVDIAGRENGPIIIEIVGVDNITGVGASDGNNGTSMNTNLVVAVVDDGTTNTGQNNGTGMQSNSNNNSTITSMATVGKNDVSVYPNPVIDQTNVVTVGEILGRSMEVMDLSGHVVMNMIIAKNCRQSVLDLSGLTPGLYILNYKLEDGRVISKRIQKV